jgi:hypothetical protein
LPIFIPNPESIASKTLSREYRQAKSHYFDRAF